MKKENDDVERVSIEVPKISGGQAAESSDVVDDLVSKYKMSEADTEALFNGIVAIYIRGRMVYGDRQPTACGAAACGGDELN